MKKHSKAKKRKKRVKARVKSSKSIAFQSRSVGEVKKLALLNSEDFLTLEQIKQYWLLGEWENGRS